MTPVGFGPRAFFFGCEVAMDGAGGGAHVGEVEIAVPVAPWRARFVRRPRADRPAGRRVDVNMDRRAIFPAILGLTWLMACGAATTSNVDYRAEPGRRDQDWGDRLHLERDGVRVLVGPASVFPYVQEGADGARQSGRYQLFTRVLVENVGTEPLEVIWSEARLAGPGGASIRLVDVESVAGEGERRGAAIADPGAALPADSSAKEAEPESEPLEVQVLAPGERVLRALIPVTAGEGGVGEPMVRLCDACVYRLILPVRRAGREEGLELEFRLRAIPVELMR